MTWAGIVSLTIVLVVVLLAVWRVRSTRALGPSFQLERSIRKYIINLDRREDRMAVTLPKLRGYGFEGVERWPAVDARKLGRGDLERLVKVEAIAPIWANRRTEHHQLSIGAVGCYLSHLQLWVRLLRSSDTRMLVFEDDTNPTMTSDEVDRLLAELPDDCDVLLLGVFEEHDRSKRPTVRKVTSQFYGMHAYIIHRRCVSTLLAHALPMDMQIDSWLSKLAANGTVCLYTVSHSGWLQSDDIRSSDIQTPVSSVF